MMHRIGIGIVLIALACCISDMADAKNSTHATPGSKQHRRMDIPLPPTTEQIVQGYCAQNPDDCKRNVADPRARTRRANCIDGWGNDDGYVSNWEVDRYGRNCAY